MSPTKYKNYVTAFYEIVVTYYITRRKCKASCYTFETNYVKNRKDFNLSGIK